MMRKFKYMLEELNCYSTIIEAEDRDAAQEIFEDMDWFEDFNEEPSGAAVDIQVYELDEDSNE
jgi:hypothetical protein